MADGNGTAKTLEELIRSKHTVIAIESREERRVEKIIQRIGEGITPEPYAIRYWSRTTGITDSDGVAVDDGGLIRNSSDAVEHVIKTKERAIYVFRDIHPDLSEALLCRMLRDAAKSLKGVKREVSRTIILLSPYITIPADLEADVHKLVWPLPNRDELKAVLEVAKRNLSKDMREAMTEDDCEHVISASLGLTVEEASSAMALSIIKLGKLDPKLIIQEKKQKIAKSGRMEWLEPFPDGLAALGDLENIKDDLKDKAEHFSQDAKEYGLATPKGIILWGPAGNGKTALVKALAGEWGWPAVRMNMAAQQSGLHGGTEQNLLADIAIVEACAPCLLLIDEFDEGIGGGDSINEVDNRAAGEIQTWLSDRTAPVYVIGTTNNLDRVERERPQLVRKGRFDDKWYIPLPSEVGRKAIFDVHVARVKCCEKKIDTDKLALASGGFSGVEIEAAVNGAKGTAYKDGKRPVSTADILAIVKGIIPTSKSASDRIAEMEQWSKGKARWASKTAALPGQKQADGLDLETR